jgi:hypothetical protein
MDVSRVIKQRLAELALDQRDLAAAAQVTESYISQLLTRRKAPPAPTRTDLYDRIGDFLSLPPGELARLAEVQRREELKQRVEQATPLFAEVRELVLRKCSPARRKEISNIFQKAPFGELERLVTQKLLDVAQSVAAQELESAAWLGWIAEHTGRSYEQVRVAVLEFLDTDVFNVSIESCVSFLDPILESWDIHLKTFAIEVVLSARMRATGVKRFEFTEQRNPVTPEPGFERFLRDPSLSGTATEAELAFLRSLRLADRRPTELYYYRELQSLRDPLHFSQPQQT